MVINIIYWKITPTVLHISSHACFISVITNTQGDHSPDNVKFPDNSPMVCSTLPQHFSMLTVTHNMPILVLNTCMDASMQLTVNSFRQLLPDKFFSDTSLTFSTIPDSCQIPWHFLVFHTSGHPEYINKIFAVTTTTQIFYHLVDDQNRKANHQ